MKFTVTKDHRHFFNQEGFIEFEELLSSDQFIDLKNSINQALCKKLQKTPNELYKSSPNEIFLAGRDLWRENNGVKKIVLAKRYGSLLAELINVTELHIGYDQLLPQSTEERGDLKNFLNISPWVNGSSIQGISGGLLLFLDEYAGGGVFIHKDSPLSLSKWQEKGALLLITFIGKNSVYKQNSLDPINYFLKNQGLNYGDRLIHLTHPKVAP